MSNKLILLIIFICAVIFLSPIRPAKGYNVLTYNEPYHFLWTSRSFKDGTILLNFMNFINSTYMEPIFYYRIIYLNGTIVPLSIKIPDIEEFNFRIGNYGANPYY